MSFNCYHIGTHSLLPQWLYVFKLLSYWYPLIVATMAVCLSSVIILVSTHCYHNGRMSFICYHIGIYSLLPQWPYVFHLLSYCYPLIVATMAVCLSSVIILVSTHCCHNGRMSFICYHIGIHSLLPQWPYVFQLLSYWYPLIVAKMVVCLQTVIILAPTHCYHNGCISIILSPTHCYHNGCMSYCHPLSFTIMAICL